ncbi:response regulator [Isoptericola croceus]|uniref:response regulator n=1 Tax=Isoptericola croceus TaxID=3031406 RepID=UPI0023F74DE2|nr:response regulator [Isoptericola croceus]
MITVLVVDDDFMVAKVHRGFVERVDGFEVCGTAHNAADALSAVARLEPDLVLLDIYLPDRSGLEVISALRDHGQAVDVLAVTAAQDAGTVQAALRGGVVHYLIKPFTFDALRVQLERYAASRRHLRESASVSQEEVDQLFRSPVSRNRLPKGLAAPTIELVSAALREAGEPVSAAECAELAGISRVSARRYLEHLVTQGLAEMTMRYGSRGRPEHRYSWSG